MHLPVVGHGAVDLQVLQQPQHKVGLFHGLLHGDGLGKEIYAGLDPRRHGALDILPVILVRVDLSGGGAPQADADHDEFHAVSSYGLPVNGVVLAGPILIGGHVDAEAGVKITAQIFQPVAVPGKVPVIQAALLHTLIDWDLLPVVGKGPLGIAGDIDLLRLEAGLLFFRLLLRRRLLVFLSPGGFHTAEIPDAALQGHILQDHFPLDARCQDQVSHNGHTGQRSAVRAADHQGAIYIFPVRLRGLDQGLDHIAQNVDDLRPGDGVRGTEIAVHGVVHIAPDRHLRHRGTGIFRNLVRVSVGQPGCLRVDVEGTGDHGDCLLAGNGISRQGLAVVAQIHPGGVQLQNGLLPVIAPDVREGLHRRDRLEMEKTVHDARESAPGNGGVWSEGPVLIALDDAVFLAPLIDGSLGPVAFRVGKGPGGGQQQPGSQRPAGQPSRQLKSFHGSSFLSVFVGSYHRKTPQPPLGCGVMSPFEQRLPLLYRRFPLRSISDYGFSKNIMSPLPQRNSRQASSHYKDEPFAAFVPPLEIISETPKTRPPFCTSFSFRKDSRIWETGPCATLFSRAMGS